MRDAYHEKRIAARGWQDKRAAKKEGCVKKVAECEELCNKWAADGVASCYKLHGTINSLQTELQHVARLCMGSHAGLYPAHMMLQGALPAPDIGSTKVVCCCVAEPRGSGK